MGVDVFGHTLSFMPDNFLDESLVNFLFGEERDSLFCFWTNWEWGIRCNITADDVESWWLTWWIAWWVSPSKLSGVCMREWKEDGATLGE